MNIYNDYNKIKNIVISSESESIKTFNKIKIREYVLDDPFILYDPLWKYSAYEYTDGFTYNESINYGVNNYLNISIPIKNIKTNVFAFSIFSGDEIINIDNKITNIIEDGTDNLYFNDGREEYIIIRDINMFNYYYDSYFDKQTSKDLINCFPNMSQHASECKLRINKHLYNLELIKFYMNDLLGFYNVYSSNKYNYLSFINTFQIPQLPGGDISKTQMQVDLSLPFYQYYYQTIHNFHILHVLNILAVPINKNLVLESSYEINSSNPINDGLLTYVNSNGEVTIHGLCFTKTYYNLKNILECLKKYNKLTNESLLNDTIELDIKNEIKRLEIILDHNNIIKCWEIILNLYNKATITTPINPMYFTQNRNNTYNFRFYNLQNKENEMSFDIGCFKDIDEILTIPEFEKITYEYSLHNDDYNNINFTYMDIYRLLYNITTINHKKIIDFRIDSLIDTQRLLNNFNKAIVFKEKKFLKKAPEDNDFIDENSSIIKIKVKNDNNNLKLYCLSFLYFNHINHYPLLTVKKLVDINDLFNQFSLGNLKKILSKLILAFDGYKLLNNSIKFSAKKISDIEPIFNSAYLTEIMAIHFVEYFNSSFVINNLIKITYYNTIKSKHIIYNIEYNINSKSFLLHDNIGLLKNVKTRNYKTINKVEFNSKYDDLFVITYINPVNPMIIFDDMYGFDKQKLIDTIVLIYNNIANKYIDENLFKNLISGFNSAFHELPNVHLTI